MSQNVTSAHSLMEVKVAEEDIAGQVDEIARIAPEIRKGLDEFFAEDPEAEG